MASSSSSSSSRRKKQEVTLARTDDYTDHYEDEEVQSSMLQARGLGAVTQGIYKIFGFTTGSEDYRETPEDIFDEGKEVTYTKDDKLRSNRDQFLEICRQNKFSICTTWFEKPNDKLATIQHPRKNNHTHL